MKGMLLPAGLVLTVIFAIVARLSQVADTSPSFIPYQEYLAAKISIGCAPTGPGTGDGIPGEPEIPLLDGWGNFTWAVTTSNDSAQIYFNQGISMYYSFHMIEAKASFAKATRFDPDCAMAWWGLAMAYGVNYNYAMLKNAPEAMDAMSNALKYMNNESELEKELVNTLPARYNADTSVSRNQQNKDYELAIMRVHQKYPADANVAALHADALMVQHPWDMYDIEGKPKPWTPAIVALLEKALQTSPGHPSLNHLYIHAVEGANDAEKALPNAWRLSTMMPMVSHMVHMPSHIFIRTGYYREGIQVNDSSINGFNAYYAAMPEVEGDAFLYLVHNLHMKAACTMYRGNSKDAYNAATQLQQAIPTKYMEMGGGMGNYMQYAYSTPVFMQVRFGWWDSLIAAPRISNQLKYAWAVQAFGKGMAWAKKGESAKAKSMLADLVSLENDASMREKFETINPADKSLGVMTALLRGSIEMGEKNLKGAIQHFENAVKLEDGFAYQEPRDWLLPTRHYLGAALLQQQQFADARRVYEAELVINPKNVWSLYGLYTSERAMGKGKNAEETFSLFEKASQDADVKIKSSTM